MLVSLLAYAALAADCEAPIPPSHLSSLLDEAERAFIDLDIDAFIARTDELRAAIPCLSAVPAPSLVARIHRTEGLRLFGERNVASVRAFAAARAIEPDYVFPPEVVPAGSPILADATAMDPSTGRSEELPAPAEGRLHIDGREGLQRPLAWPSLVQLVADDSTPIWSVYLPHDSQAPAYEVRPPQLEAVVPALPDPLPPETAPVRSPLRLPLLVAAGGSALVSGVTYGAAWLTRARWANPETEDERLPTLRARTNTLAGTSVVTGLTAVSLGAMLAFTW